MGEHFYSRLLEVKLNPNKNSCPSVGRLVIIFLKGREVTHIQALNGELLQESNWSESFSCLFSLSNFSLQQSYLSVYDRLSKIFFIFCAWVGRSLEHPFFFLRMWQRFSGDSGCGYKVFLGGYQIFIFMF